MPRACGPILLLAAGLAAPAVAAPSGRVTVDITGGHDDNMFLATAPTAAEPLLRLGGWFGGLAPELAGAITFRGFRLQASYQGDLRASDAVGQLGYHEGNLALLLPTLGPLRLHLGGAAGRFDATRYPDDRFLFAGGLAGLRLSLGSLFEIGTNYRVERRWLGAAATSADLLHAVEGQLTFTPTTWLELGPRGSLVMVLPGADQAEPRFRRMRAGLDVSLLLGRLTATVAGWGGTLELDDTAEAHAGGRIEARVSLGDHVSLFASYDLTVPTSAGASQDYARQLALLGTSVGFAGTVRPPPAPEPEQRPMVERGRVRFRLRAAGAGSVAVVGSWNDWQTPGRTLAATREAGLYEAWIDLPGGSYRYHFVVDGQAQKPPEAPRYAPDGFGGEDGVVDVPPQADTPPSPAGESVASPRRSGGVGCEAPYPHGRLGRILSGAQ